MRELIETFLQAIFFAVVGTAMMVVVLGLVIKFLKLLGWIVDGLREYAIYWWALGALSLLPRDSKTAREIRCRHDLHDYCDGEPYEPWHFHVYCCDRCGKRFTI